MKRPGLPWPRAGCIHDCSYLCSEPDFIPLARTGPGGGAFVWALIAWLRERGESGVGEGVVLLGCERMGLGMGAQIKEGGGAHTAGGSEGGHPVIDWGMG